MRRCPLPSRHLFESRDDARTSSAVRGCLSLALFLSLVAVAPAGATTPTPTPTVCATVTPEPLWVDPVISHTDEMSQIVRVYVGHGDRVDIETASGTFTATGDFDAYANPAEVRVDLLPDTTHHLQVTAHVGKIESEGCTYGDYSLFTTRDRFGDALTIVRGTAGSSPSATPTPTPSPRPQRTGDLGTKVVHGKVYDASVGPSTPLAGATVRYAHYSPVNPGGSGSLVTGADGQYAFDLFLHDTDAIQFTVEAPGFRTATAYTGGYELWSGPAPDFAMIPLGGEIEVDPVGETLHCSGSFDITISNVDTSGESLLITRLDLHHGYSQGYYGTGFTWDLGGVELPLSLPSGESLVIPVSFSAAGQSFPSRLHLDLESGARNTDDLESHGLIVYYGEIGGCGEPTRTPPACTGDCDGDGEVAINELVRGVSIGLEAMDIGVCSAIDGDGDGEASIAELVTAVDHALYGCSESGSNPIVAARPSASLRVHAPRRDKR